MTYFKPKSARNKNDKTIRPYEESAKKHYIHDLQKECWYCVHCNNVYNIEGTARLCCANNFACTQAGCDNRINNQSRYAANCESCREKRSEEVWENRKRKEWDGVSLLYSDTQNRFFNDLDEAYDYLENPGDSLETLRLRICEQMPKPFFDVYDWLCDSLPDDFDGDLPGADAIQQQVSDYFDSIISYIGWEPGSYALDISPYDDATKLVTEASVRRFSPPETDYPVKQALNYMGTVIGRINCSTPNLANQPAFDFKCVFCSEKAITRTAAGYASCNKHKETISAETEQPKPCSCNVIDLMNSGCQCGGS